MTPTLNAILSQLRERTFLVLDTETTGFEKTSRILQIGITSARSEVLFDQIIHPDHAIDESSGAYAVNRIGNAQIEGQPSFRDIYRVFSDLIQDEVVLIYNASFDW